MVAAKEEETVKVGVESGTVKTPTAKLMALLHGLQGALRKKHGDNDDDAALNLKECKIIWIKKKLWNSYYVCVPIQVVIWHGHGFLLR